MPVEILNRTKRSSAACREADNQLILSRGAFSSSSTTACMSPFCAPNTAMSTPGPSRPDSKRRHLSQAYKRNTTKNTGESKRLCKISFHTRLAKYKSNETFRISHQTKKWEYVQWLVEFLRQWRHAHVRQCARATPPLVHSLNCYWPRPSP